ncbi:hypothetical protein ACFFRR_001576 [Megaselia abdita]
MDISRNLLQWNHLKDLCDRLSTELGLYEKLDKLARLSAKHPYWALGITITLASILLPFLIILAFGISTIVMTFTGFILIEGTLITIASVLLFGVLGALMIIFLFFGGLTLAGYLGFVHIYDLYNNSGNTRSALMEFLNRERLQNENESDM